MSVWWEIGEWVVVDSKTRRCAVDRLLCALTQLSQAYNGLRSAQV